MSAVDLLSSACVELQIADMQKPGVYVLLWRGVVQYVGESSNVLARVGMHCRSFDFDRILYIPEGNKRERRAIEAAIARRFAPPMSSVFSRRDQDRDVEILARFGLEPDADNARLVGERTDACWSRGTQSKASSARSRAFHSRILWNAVRPLLRHTSVPSTPVARRKRA